MPARASNTNTTGYDYDLTEAMAEYLAAIWKLYEIGEQVNPAALSERLGVSAQAVSSMLKRLAERGFIKRTRYQAIELTPLGRRAALSVVRRHRLLEVFLMEVMKFTWDQVDAEAYCLQHVISSAFEDRMDELCDYPTHCPHGDPIPTKDGEIRYLATRPLVELPEGTRATLRRVASDSPTILRYLGGLGLQPTVEVILESIAPFKGPVQVKCNNNGKVEQLLLGYELASLLYVEPVGQERTD